MLQKPELAAHVHSFTLRPSIVHKSDQPTSEQWPTADAHAKLKSAIEKYLLDEDLSQDLLVAIQVGCNEAAILSLLLPLLINLRSMDVPFDFEDGGTMGAETEYIIQMLLRAGHDQNTTEEPLFTKLPDVMLAGTNDRYPDSPDWFAACVGLPAVKRIYGHNQGNEDGDADDTHVFSKLQQGSSAVEYIELRRLKLNISNFAFLLEAPKCLKTLIYEIGNTWAWTEVNTSAIQSALERQPSIERLSLGHIPDYYPFTEESDKIMPMSFSDSTSLIHLRVALVFLCGPGIFVEARYDSGSPNTPAPTSTPNEIRIEETKMVLVNALPSQIETLGLLNCTDSATLNRVRAWLQELLARKARFRNLHEVSIHGIEPDVLKANLAMLVNLPWSENGVRLVIKAGAEVSYSKRLYKNRPWG